MRRILPFYTIALFIIPIIADVLQGWQRIMHYYAADTFLYLTVARHGNFSFDGINPTNGFHPLWQVLLTLLYQIPIRDAWYHYAVLMVSVACIAGALGLIASAWQERLLPYAFVALPVGVYAVLNAPFSTQYGTLWSMANGMETPLLLLCYAVLLWAIVRDLNAGAVGLIMTCFVLARLDHVFIALALGLIYPLRRRWQETFIIAGIVGVSILLYLLINYAYAGVALPVSGTMKEGFPQLANNLRRIALAWERQEYAVLWRANAIFTPMLGALAYLIWRVPRLRYRLQWGLIGTATGILLLGTYNLCAVYLFHQGHWYFPVSELALSLFVMDVMPPLPRVSVILLLALGVLWFRGIYWSEIYNTRYADFFTIATEMQNRYAANPPVLLSFDDGIVAYATGFRTINGMGFTLDKAGTEARETGQLIAWARSQGATHVTSYNYMTPRGFEYGMTSAEIHAVIHRAAPFWYSAELRQTCLRIDHIGTNGKGVLLAFC